MLYFVRPCIAIGDFLHQRIMVLHVCTPTQTEKDSTVLGGRVRHGVGRLETVQGDACEGSLICKYWRAEKEIETENGEQQETTVEKNLEEEHEIA